MDIDGYCMLNNLITSSLELRFTPNVPELNSDSKAPITVNNKITE